MKGGNIFTFIIVTFFVARFPFVVNDNDPNALVVDFNLIIVVLKNFPVDRHNKQKRKYLLGLQRYEY